MYNLLQCAELTDCRLNSGTEATSSLLFMPRALERNSPRTPRAKNEISASKATRNNGTLPFAQIQSASSVATGSNMPERLPVAANCAAADAMKRTKNQCFRSRSGRKQVPEQHEVRKQADYHEKMAATLAHLVATKGQARKMRDEPTIYLNEVHKNHE